MNQINQIPVVGRAAKFGAILFALWGILHLWVGFEGVHQYITAGAHGLWGLLTGGVNAPRETFQHATDAVTAHVHAQLILNFCIDVGGYGVLGLVVGWEIWRKGSWLAYLIGVLVIGIADLAFLFAMVIPGIIELNFGTISGPAIWFLAIAITPFGLPRLRNGNI